MAKPVLMAVDDDPDVLRTVERDLRHYYGGRYRILCADSGAAALDLLGRLQERKETVALFLVDQRMPRMSGVEFLAQAVALFPAAKRVLLTAYADTEAAIAAINSAHVDYYRLKPWDPPEEHLYPVLDDLLDDWQANYRPPFEGIRVIGLRWSPGSHQLKDFLARNEVPYQWLDIETAPEAHPMLIEAGADTPHLPVVLFPDGTHLAEPTTAELAERLGLRIHAERAHYDLLIVGGGPSGLAAAVYGASEGLGTALIEREAPGGQAGSSSRIENYLGFPVGLSGGDLARRAVAQARRFGVEILAPQEVTGIRLADPYRYVTLGDGSEISCHALLIATGVQYRSLEVPGVAELTGAGVYYGAALTEAFSCKGDDVYIVGGANSAGQAAMYFSGFARTVTILVRGASLEDGMSHYLIDEIADQSNIVVRTRTEVVAAQGEGHLQTLTLLNNATGDQETVPATAVFIFIGAQPRTEWLGGVVARDENGFILSGRDLAPEGARPAGWLPAREPFLLETCVPGIFVAGDVRHRSVKRVASAVGEGAMAIMFVHQYLSTV